MMEGSRSSSSNSCFTCQTRGRTEWCVLTDEELKLLDKGKVSRDYLPGEVIFHEADACQGIHCIESGLVGVRKMNANGQEILLRLGYPGDTLGYRSMLSGDDHNNSAEALEPSEVCFIDAATVRTLLTRNPTLGLRFLNHAATDLSAAEDKVLQSTTLPVRARFAHLLLVLKDRYGVGGEDGAMVLELPLSRQDMAAMIGIRPESMSRTIRSLEEDDIARFSGRRVHVRNIDDLIEELELAEGL
ncbi:MAG: Crp/Fnr family transcriptional regulator [Rhodospirillales bacterium]|nr:Crp/Fnr family transcriptional regulator [Rhodospirillales bacterium]